MRRRMDRKSSPPFRSVVGSVVSCGGMATVFGAFQHLDILVCIEIATIVSTLLMTTNRRRSAASGGAPVSMMADGLGGGGSGGSWSHADDDDENPFESIGRALDHHCEELGATMDGTQHHECSSEYHDDSRLQMPIEGSPTSRDYHVVDGNGDIVDNSSMTMTHSSTVCTREIERGCHQQKENRSEPSQIIHAPDASTTRTSETRQQVVVALGIQAHSNTPIRDNNMTKMSQVSKQRKISPHRFTFQTSTKPKSTSFKTPARKSLPTEDVFSSSAMSQRVTANRSTRKSIGNESATQKRNQRHTFRISMDRSNAPTVDNNVREMRFVPTFLSNAKVGSDNAHEDMPVGENDDDNADHSNNDDDTSPFRHNIVSDHYRAQQLINQSLRKYEQSHGKSGYLVQRLRSLRNADQRMVMQLRSGQTAPSGTTTGVSIPRKRRRSGGDYLDPRNNATTIMDVTVSGASVSVCKFDEGKAILLAYIHCYNTMNHSSDHSDVPYDGLSYPCFALIVMSRDVVQEKGIVGSKSKQLRIYDGVVVPPPLGTPLDSDWNADSGEGKPDHSKGMPTIIRTHICEEYPSSVPLPDVTFIPSSQEQKSNYIRF